MDLLYYYYFFNQWFYKHSVPVISESSERLALLRGKNQDNGMEQLHEREEQASNETLAGRSRKKGQGVRRGKSEI